jgi:hypothetical protein
LIHWHGKYVDQSSLCSLFKLGWSGLLVMVIWDCDNCVMFVCQLLHMDDLGQIGLALCYPVWHINSLFCLYVFNVIRQIK